MKSKFENFFQISTQNGLECGDLKSLPFLMICIVQVLSQHILRFLYKKCFQLSNKTKYSTKKFLLICNDLKNELKVNKLILKNSSSNSLLKDLNLTLCHREIVLRNDSWFDAYNFQI